MERAIKQGDIKEETQKKEAKKQKRKRKRVRKTERTHYIFNKHTISMAKA